MRDDLIALIAGLTNLRDAIADGQAIASREDVRNACNTLSLSIAAHTAQGETTQWSGPKHYKTGKPLSGWDAAVAQGETAPAPSAELNEAFRAMVAGRELEHEEPTDADLRTNRLDTRGRIRSKLDDRVDDAAASPLPAAEGLEQLLAQCPTCRGSGKDPGPWFNSMNEPVAVSCGACGWMRLALRAVAEGRR